MPSRIAVLAHLSRVALLVLLASAALSSLLVAPQSNGASETSRSLPSLMLLGLVLLGTGASVAQPARRER